jgi:hypothetical protein
MVRCKQSILMMEYGPETKKQLLDWYQTGNWEQIQEVGISAFEKSEFVEILLQRVD